MNSLRWSSGTVAISTSGGRLRKERPTTKPSVNGSLPREHTPLATIRPVRQVEDEWPEFWQQVEEAVAAAGATLRGYSSEEHPHVRRVFSLDWDLLEPLLDDVRYQHIRFRIFDADDLAYRFRVIGRLTQSGSVRLVDFSLVE